MFGDLLFGEIFFGGSAASSGDTDTPVTNVIIHDATGRITYLPKSGVKILSENSSVYIFNEEPSWVRT